MPTMFCPTERKRVTWRGEVMSWDRRADDAFLAIGLPKSNSLVGPISYR
jgi:hypothetical protein